MEKQSAQVYGQDFLVSIPHYYCLEYTEGDHVMEVEIDFRNPVPCLDGKAIKAWRPPYDKENIGSNKKKSIMRNIIEYLQVVKGFPAVEIINEIK